MRRKTVGKKQLDKKTLPSSPLPLLSNKLAFGNQTKSLFRSTDDDGDDDDGDDDDGDDDDGDDVNDGDIDDPASSPFVRMVRKTTEEAKTLMCGGEIQLR